MTKRQRVQMIIAHVSILTGLCLPLSTQAAACCRCHEAGDKVNTTCIQTDTVAQGQCDSLPQNTKNNDLQSLVCEETPNCTPISQGTGGTCLKGPLPEAQFKNTDTGSVSSDQAEPSISLNIPIPGLQLSAPEKQNGILSVPFFAQYVSAVYRYLLGISAIAAAIMIVYGGFKYILAGTGVHVQEGQKVIKDALIGLVLLLGTYTILQTIAPATITLKKIEVPLIKPDPINSYMGANAEAPATLAEVGIMPNGQTATQNLVAPNTIQAEIAGDEIVPPPSTANMKTNLTIPKSCPGRDVDFNSVSISIGGVKLGYNSNALAIPLTDDEIKMYLEEQSRTGIPAAVLIAQMMTETGSTKSSQCIVKNLFKNPQTCGTADYFKYYNFGGVGCSVSQVPSGVCPHVAFFPDQTKKFGLGGCDAPDGPNPNFNKYLAACTEACHNSTRNTYTTCGEDCYPQQSHTTANINGTEVWFPSVQCSRKFKNAQDFLESHLGFVKYCLPYNDSVYKFAYCVGASTYASTGLKGPLLAEIIERNCLCGSQDSSKCVRNKDLETKLAQNVIRKKNLNLFSKKCLSYDSRGKCKEFQKGSGPDYEAIIKALQESTKGALSPFDYPQNDALPVGNTVK